MHVCIMLCMCACVHNVMAENDVSRWKSKIIVKIILLIVIVMKLCLVIGTL